MLDLIKLILPYYENPDDFTYLRKILNINEPYKIKFSVDLLKLSPEEKILNTIRIALEHYIENELLNKNVTDVTLYNNLLIQFNEVSIQQGYEPFYKITGYQHHQLKRFPTPYFKGHSDQNNYFYPVCDYLPLNDWIVPRYHRPRVYYHEIIS